MEITKKEDEALTLVMETIAFESGELNDADIINLFAKIVSNGLAWQFQGSYGRTAKFLIDEGYIDAKGNVLSYP